MIRTTQLTAKQEEFLRELVTYIRQEKRPPTNRELQQMMSFRSPRSVGQYLEALESSGYIQRGQGARNIKLLQVPPALDRQTEATVLVPIVGSAPCGAPVFAEENIKDYVAVSTKLANPSHRYFLLRATGDSMTEVGILDGNLVLVRQQRDANNGDRVVALIDGEATIKEFHRTSNAIVLKPRSTNKRHQPIILTDDFQILGVVQSVIDL